DFYIRGISRLGIPEIRMSDGPVGVHLSEPTVALPASIALAASFNTNLANKYGAAIGSEARSNNIHIMLGPGMNIHRALFCGRNFEYLGEDPYLAGKLASSYIFGMQNEGVMATAKHYAVNFQEYERHQVSSNLDERTLHEIYLPAFKRCVEEGKVAAVMTSYNLINGVHASQNDYLNNKVLKGEWGFNGFIMSDWASTYDGLACAKGGLDLEMPSAKLMNSTTLLPFIKNGTLDIKVIDDKIRRILTEYVRFGLLKNANIAKEYTFDKEKSRLVAINTAREGIVLLKNDNRFLPIDVKKIKTIAVIGPNGDPAITGGGGSSYVKSLHPISAFEAVKGEVGDNVKVTYAKGVSTGDKVPENFFDSFDFYTKDKNGNKTKGVYAEFYDNINLEGDIVAKITYDKLNITKNELGVKNISDENCSVRFTCYFSPKESAEYWVATAGDDGYRLFVDGQKKLESWKRQGEVVTKYHAYFEKGKEYKFVVEYFQSGGGAAIRLAAQKRVDKDEDRESLMSSAIENAKNADLVILSVGFNVDTEAEGLDRTFDLPFNQNELIKNIAAVNKNTVVVLNSGGNINMNGWIDNVKGLLQAWYPGQEGNKAVSEIIFGKTNPSGKLPVSFEYKPEDNPTFKSYWTKGKDLHVEFTEGIFMGYRFYDKSDVKPRFPFGFGLSYTTFVYGNMKTPVTTIKAGEKIKFSIDISNIGKMDGAEAVQVYVSDLKSSLPRPVKELKAFDKVFLTKGETKTLEFELDKDAFSFYDPEKHGWIIEPGDFKVSIGSSSVDIRHEFNIFIK
ncbi:MAG: hypothetical protein AUK44_01155, partial [Porphyromonadaceae bacterium CG2_30_38_12]